MIGSHSAPASRFTVTKSLTPKIVFTPGAAKTASAKGFPLASAGLLMLIVSGSVMSRLKRSAFGLGLGEGVAVTIRPPALHAPLRFLARKPARRAGKRAKNQCYGGESGTPTPTIASRVTSA